MEPDTATGSGQPVVVTNLEVAAHETFDRVVLTLGGNGRAGWLAEYVEQALAQGSGDPVEVGGDATLEVTLTNIAYPTDAPADAYDGPDRMRARNTQAIVEVVYGTTFEGQTQLWVGTTQRLPFRVFALQDPDRVVVDVVQPESPA
ncbi:MAG: hypothetical protein M3N32_00085 [Actinomycetota bacterium]|nr:hypothetical protein [Actinomycetota bacterium]